MGYKITIDGPAGTGKGTLAREIAKELNIGNVDSGMIYRAFGLYSLRNNIDINNEKDIKQALQDANIRLDLNINPPRVYIKDEDVSSLIRNEEVAARTTIVAKIKIVREYVLKIQRQLGEESNIVMEGRDIGSVVFPNAELKIYLTADAKERAKRRYKELVEKGKEATFEEVYEKILKRDKEDSTRKESPLIKTSDMIEIDSTNMTIEQVVERVKGLVREKKLGCG